MTSYLAGFGTGLSLIAAIGAQNAFVLRQGLLRRHVLAVCLFCALSDALLIGLGVAGMAVLGAGGSGLTEAMRWGGVAFLVVYGGRALLAALRGGQALRAEGRAAGLGASLATIAVLTWLNPHVWLDTVVLLGAISAQWPSRAGFAAGAVSASFAFFFALGYGARLLAPVFARPAAWRWLDLGVGTLMWAIAARLAVA